MIALRLILLIPFTLMMGIVAIGGYQAEKRDLSVAFALITALGILGIVRTFKKRIRFKRIDDILVMETIFGSPTQVNLSTTVSWAELGFNIRGQRRKTVLILVPKNEQIIIDNSEYPEELDDIINYLTTSYPERKDRERSSQ